LVLLSEESVVQNQKERVALISMLSSGALAVAKFAIGFLTGSIGLISEGVHSSSDFVATVVTWWAVRISDKPADANHHFGHGKMESMAALFEVLLLFGAAGWIALEAGKRLLGEPHVIEAAPIAIAILVVSIVVDFWRVRALRRVTKATRSPALEADALHFLSDMLASGVVLVGMIFVIYGYLTADAVAALVVACFILTAAVRLGIRTFNSLVDAAPADDGPAVSSLVSQIPQVIAVERTRLRVAGATLFVELTIAVSRTMPLDRVATLKVEVIEAVQRKFPNAEVTVTTEPRALDDETIETRIRVIASNQGAAVHRLTVQRVSGRLSISLDLEVAADLSVTESHDIASELETAIREELGRATEIDTHIEPMMGSWLRGEEVSAKQSRALQEALSSAAGQTGIVRHIHDVRVRRTDLGLIVNFHCEVPAEMGVTEAHDAVDELERQVRTLHPEVTRVIGHAEPQGLTTAASPR
jgi:cation diffusion facilitator family transporter